MLGRALLLRKMVSLPSPETILSALEGRLQVLEVLSTSAAILSLADAALLDEGGSGVDGPIVVFGRLISGVAA